MVVAPVQKMRVISWNLLHGQKIPPTGTQNWQVELETAAKTVSDKMQPDFLALQEVDNFQSRSGFVNQSKLIAESMQFKHWAYLPTLIGTPGEKWEKVRDLQAALITQDTAPREEMSYGIGIATADVNNDGWVDFYLTNLKQNQLFINQSGKGFKQLNIDEKQHLWSSSASFCDINNDGWPDLLVTNGFITTDDTGDL